MGLTGDAKRDYQRRYMERKRSNIGSNKSEGSNAGSNNVTPAYADLGDGHRCPGVPVTPLSRPGGTPQNDTTEGTIDAIPRRSMGKTPEECGYPAGQVDVHTGPQGQKLWRLNGHYDMPNRILCFRA